MREITDSIGIIDQLAEVITDTRHQSYVLHDNKTLLKQRILQIACGYEDAKVLVNQFIASYKTPPAAIILDIDDTDDPTHGAQQLSLFNGTTSTAISRSLSTRGGQAG